MSKTWNVDDLREKLRRVFDSAQQVRVTLDDIAKASSPDAADAASNAALTRKKEWLECHARDFIIDHLLGALNWQKTPEIEPASYVQANLIIEHSSSGSAQPQKLKTNEMETRKRMDYLGYERATNRPLLIVEAKRPDLQIPGGPIPSSSPGQHRVAAMIKEYLVRTRIRESTQRGGGLNVEWQEYLSQIRGYSRELFQSQGTWPKCVVLSNGEWLIVFSNPEDAFSGDDAAADPEESIAVFDSWDRLVTSADVLWDHLEYGRLARNVEECLPAELPFLVDPGSIQSCMFALRILYAETPAIYERRPRLTISPVLLLRSRDKSFMAVASRWEAVIPNDRDDAFGPHLEQVATCAAALKRRTEEVLGCGNLPMTTIEEHVAERDAFEARSMVHEFSRRRIGDAEVATIVLTGSHPHILLPSSDYVNCPFHMHGESVKSNMAQCAHPIAQAQRDPRSYFVDGSRFHCTHREVHAAKRQSVTEQNRERCGPRSSKDGGAFCEVWRLEEMLCCRTCVFQQVCTAATVFRIPCPDPQQFVQVTASSRVPMQR